MRQEGIVDLYQKQEAIYEDFTKSVGSVTCGVKNSPSNVSLLMCLCLTDEVMGTLTADANML